MLSSILGCSGAYRCGFSARLKMSEVPEVESPSGSSSSGAEPWLTEGIIVKVVNQDLAGGKYYRKKGKVVRVKEQFAAEIRMVEGK